MKDPFELNAKSIMALYELFPTEEACIKHLEAINWHGKPVSPFDKTCQILIHNYSTICKLVFYKFCFSNQETNQEQK